MSVGPAWKLQGDLLPPKSPEVAKKRAEREHRRVTKRMKLRGLQVQCRWLPRSALLCGTRMEGKDPDLCRSSHGRPVWHGIAHCKNLRACPLCLDFAMGRWRDQLTDLMLALRDRGGCCVLVTYTLRHGVGDDIRNLRKLLSKSQRLMVSGRRAVEMFKRIGYIGQARTVEVTHSDVNGYHPHTHALFFLRKPLSDAELAAFKETMAARWVEAVKSAAGALGMDVGLPDLEHGCRVDYGNNAAEYLTKMGFDSELTDAGTKQGRGGSRSMSEVATSLVVNARMGFPARAAYDETVWRAYVEGMKGFKPFWLARGLVGKVNGLPIRDDVPAELAHTAGEADKPDDAELVYTFDSHDWLRLRRAGPVAMAHVECMVEDGAGTHDIGNYVRSLPWAVLALYPDDPVYGPTEEWPDIDRRGGEDSHGFRRLPG